jgi:integrase
MSYADNSLYEFKSVKDWLNGLGSDESRRVYLIWFGDFLEWLHGHEGYGSVSPDDLIKMRQDDLKLEDVKDRRRFEMLIKQYYIEMKRQHGKAYWTSMNKLKSVRSFFSGNFLSLTYRKGELQTVRANKNEKTYPKTADVRAWYRRLESWRDRALLLLMFQSGPTPVDATSITYGDIKDKLDQEPPVFLRLVRQKTGSETQTCLHADTIYALKMMLANMGSLKDDDPVFLSRTGNALDSHSTWQIFQNNVSTKYSPKDLRDAFKYYLRQAKVDNDVQDWLMGHTGGMGAKYAPSRETIMEEYKRVMPLLSVNGEIVTEESDKKIREELAALQIDNEQLRNNLADAIQQIRKNDNALQIEGKTCELVMEAMYEFFDAIQKSGKDYGFPKDLLIKTEKKLREAKQKLDLRTA